MNKKGDTMELLIGILIYVAVTKWLEYSQRQKEYREWKMRVDKYDAERKAHLEKYGIKVDDK